MLTVGHSVIFLSVTNVNSVLSLKRIKITSLNICFEQKSLFASISFAAGVSLKTLNQDHGEKLIYTTPDCAI